MVLSSFRNALRREIASVNVGIGSLTPEMEYEIIFTENVTDASGTLVSCKIREYKNDEFGNTIKDEDLKIETIFLPSIIKLSDETLETINRITDNHEDSLILLFRERRENEWCTTEEFNLGLHYRIAMPYPSYTQTVIPRCRCSIMNNALKRFIFSGTMDREFHAKYYKNYPKLDGWNTVLYYRNKVVSNQQPIAKVMQKNVPLSQVATVRPSIIQPQQILTYSPANEQTETQKQSQEPLTVVPNQQSIAKKMQKNVPLSQVATARPSIIQPQQTLTSSPANEQTETQKQSQEPLTVLPNQQPISEVMQKNGVIMSQVATVHPSIVQPQQTPTSLPANEKTETQTQSQEQFTVASRPCREELHIKRKYQNSKGQLYSILPFPPMTYNQQTLANDVQTAINLLIFQITYYFSTENLCKDIYLRQNMDQQGYVSVEFISNFKIIQQITNDLNIIIIAIDEIEEIERSYNLVRCRHDPLKWPINIQTPPTFPHITPDSKIENVSVPPSLQSRHIVSDPQAATNLNPEALEFVPRSDPVESNKKDFHTPQEESFYTNDCGQINTNDVKCSISSGKHDDTFNKNNSQKSGNLECEALVEDTEEINKHKFQQSYADAVRVSK